METKSNSLKERGYEITKSAEPAADGVLFEVKSKRGNTYFIKKLKGDKLRAFRTKEAKDTTTIAGMFSFTEEKDGDLVGEPFKSSKPRVQKTDAAA